MSQPHSSLDTVTHAAATPEITQGHGQLGLADDEYARIRTVLGRRPTAAELTMYAVMWSEHCSYKSSKVHLKYFGETTTDQMRRHLLAGIGEQAGVVEIGDGWAATFKIESHNSPSYIDPFEGAATGVGGVVRDILAMGARPVAAVDQLRVGPLEAPDTARVLPQAVAGIANYAAGLGIANLGGETYFDDSYATRPLVNAGCVGLLRADAMHTAHASGLGNKVVLYGAATGLDGVGGAAMASASAEDAAEGELAATSSSKAPQPRIPAGNPEFERRLIEATLEAFAAGLIVGIQDLGAAGIACATSELASAGDGGMRVWLDDVPLAEDGMGAVEIFCSESQERMCAVTTPANAQQLLDICAKWDIPAVIIGEVTDTGRLQVFYQDELVVDVPPRSVAEEGPVYERPYARPAAQDALVAATTADLPRPDVAQLPALIVDMSASDNTCSKAWITQQYGSPADHAAAADPLGGIAADAGILRVADTDRGIAMAADCNARFVTLDPYRGTQLALAEAYRNVATTGATPLAVTNCLNFGSPEDPAIMWQFAEAVRGLADGCRSLGIPVTGGNVSFYNQTGDKAIMPTPVIGVLGVIDDVSRRVGGVMGRGPLPEMLFLLGDTFDELDGSQWARIAGGHLGGTPPALDLANEMRLATVMGRAAAVGMVAAAHDLSEGGLAQALVEMCVASNAGAAITLPPLDAFTALFSESASRILVAVPVSQLAAFSDLCEELDQPASALGSVTPQRKILEISGVGEIPLEELTAAHHGTVPTRFSS